MKKQVLWNKVFNVRSAERFSMAFGHFGRSFLGVLGIKTSILTKADLANRKRQLERDLREAGLSRSEAKRIAGANMRQKKPNS
ncbi:hypothetical protein [Azonexus hydrophilus]|uniref:hypothetical protein n=1 Tax=Azonexus hydrophilus TaxID=418702 RepID=UPI0012FA5F31|nr:hypothetical protein [Azonexus hydrophilus]